MRYKKGEMLVRCIIDDETGRPSYDTYRVRTIRGGKVHAIQVNEWTWIKLKWGKDQSRGWATTIDSVYRVSCREGERFDCLHRTKGAALRQAKKWQQDRIERRNRYSSNAGSHRQEVRCVWRVDNDGVWNSDCGQAHVFIDGTPGQNGFGFCPYCGKPMAEIHTPNDKLTGQQKPEKGRTL